MADKLHWYRIETDLEGKVVSCQLAVEREHDNGLIFFVRARDTRHAGRLGFNAYMLALTKARHAQYAREGKCRCGRPRDRQGVKRCSACTESAKVYKSRWLAKQKGEEPPVKLERREVIANRKVDDAAAIRLETLDDVRSAWARSESVDEFARWLAAEIERLRGKKEHAAFRRAS